MTSAKHPETPPGRHDVGSAQRIEAGARAWSLTTTASVTVHAPPSADGTVYFPDSGGTLVGRGRGTAVRMRWSAPCLGVHRGSPGDVFPDQPPPYTGDRARASATPAWATAPRVIAVGPGAPAGCAWAHPGRSARGRDCDRRGGGLSGSRVTRACPSGEGGCWPRSPAYRWCLQLPGQAWVAAGRGDRGKLLWKTYNNVPAGLQRVARSGAGKRRRIDTEKTTWSTWAPATTTRCRRASATVPGRDGLCAAGRR